jgi:hypothetical protein
VLTTNIFQGEAQAKLVLTSFNKRPENTTIKAVHDNSSKVQMHRKEGREHALSYQNQGM